MRFASNKSDFESIEAAVRTVFSTEMRLPDAVTRQRLSRFAFFEVDEVLDAPFWRVCQALARYYKDEAILMMSIDPDPQSYFKKHFGFFGAFRLRAVEEPSTYLELMSHSPENSPADSLTANGRILAYVGSSGGFGIWAQRDLEVGLICLFDTPSIRTPAKLPEGMRWVSTTGALKLMAPSFRGQLVPADIRVALLNNYPDSSNGHSTT